MDSGTLVAIGMIGFVIWALVVVPMRKASGVSRGIQHLQSELNFKVDYRHTGANAEIVIDNTLKKVAVIDKTASHLLNYNEIKSVGIKNKKAGAGYIHAVNIITSIPQTPLLTVNFRSSEEAELAQARLLAI